MISRCNFLVKELSGRSSRHVGAMCVLAINSPWQLISFVAAYNKSCSLVHKVSLFNLFCFSALIRKIRKAMQAWKATRSKMLIWVNRYLILRAAIVCRSKWFSRSWKAERVDALTVSAGSGLHTYTVVNWRLPRILFALQHLQLMHSSTMERNKMKYFWVGFWKNHTILRHSCTTLLKKFLLCFASSPPFRYEMEIRSAAKSMWFLGISENVWFTSRAPLKLAAI